KEFADLPGPFGFSSHDLQIAPREVDTDGVSIDQFRGLRRGEAATASTQSDHQLNLKVQFGCQRWIRDNAAVGAQRIRRFCKEKRCSPLVLTHLTNVFDVIATDAPDPADRKQARRSDHGERRRCWWWKNVGLCGFHLEFSHPCRAAA